MKTTFTATQVLQNIPRLTVAELQRDLAKAELELASGRFADIGLELGFRSSSSIDLRSQQTRLNGIQDTNALLAGRLDATQLAIEGIVAAGEEFFDTLLGARDARTGPEVIADFGRHLLGVLSSQLNQQFAGEYIFAGINSETPPLDDYFAIPASASKLAVDTAFQAEFGFPQDDPAAANISASQIDAFVSGTFAAVFDDTGWSANWSQASDDLRNFRIAPGAQIEAGTSANDKAFRELARAAVLAAGLGAENFNGPAFDAVVTKALTGIRKGLDQMTSIQANIGLTEARIGLESDRLGIQVDLISGQLSNLEEIDPYETATRANTLLTQIETSFALTSRIQQLSLLRFI